METRSNMMDVLPSPPPTGRDWRKWEAPGPQLKLLLFLRWVWWLPFGPTHHKFTAYSTQTCLRIWNIFWIPGLPMNDYSYSRILFCSPLLINIFYGLLRILSEVARIEQELLRICCQYFIFRIFGRITSHSSYWSYHPICLKCRK